MARSNEIEQVTLTMQALLNANGFGQGSRADQIATATAQDVIRQASAFLAGACRHGPRVAA